MSELKVLDVSPMMNQYFEIKDQYNDAILFFRLGDFYEMFFEDAKLVSDELGLTLTGKNYGQDKRAPMCGVPYHSCESYIARLISKGYKIALCDQLESAAAARGLVKREVIRVITPGTVMEESMLDESRNNYICCIYCSNSSSIAGICFCDVSTGELRVTEICGDRADVLSQLKVEIGKFSPREIICIARNEVFEPLHKFVKDKLNFNIELLEETFDYTYAKSIVGEHFENEDLSFSEKLASISSIAYLLEYLKSTQKGNLSHIGLPIFYSQAEYMGLDLNTIRNLELVETIRAKSKKGSLLWVIDKTRTAMGKRLLRSWMERPLVNMQKILLRQGAVEELFENSILRGDLKESLSSMQDIQRLMTKISYASANARDLKSLSSALEKLPEIRSLLRDTNSDMLQKMYEKLDTLSDIYDLIEDAIDEDPSFALKEGGIIKEGYSKEVDLIRKDMKGGKGIICEIEERERKRTGISKLKVRYNKVFGYFIEVTNSFKHLVPDDYIRKQTLTNCERYITEELKNLESRILHAKDKANDIEYKIFESIRDKVAESFSRVMSMANLIAALDVIRSLAEVSVHNNYVKPIMNTLDAISIKQGRHPVVESLVSDVPFVPFVPNDLLLDNDKNVVAMITGPNMAGKSTYMRQAALIVLMAQMGSFVPATEASIGIVDSIFTRIGASDDLAAGQSTFMVEMREVADILKNSTSKSLLILDEIGRGTSTFDGMSIARSVLEYVADKKKLGAKTLFATHYHELTSVANIFDNVKNYSVAVRKQNDTITFLHTIIPGSVDDSYGVEVAKLAGLPNSVISRSREILAQIENHISPKISETSTKSVKRKKTKAVKNEPPPSEIKEILDELENINILSLTPMDSMNILNNLVEMAKKTH